jgi:hypothetical protein
MINLAIRGVSGLGAHEDRNEGFEFRSRHGYYVFVFRRFIALCREQKPYDVPIPRPRSPKMSQRFTLSEVLCTTTGRRA